MNLKKIWICCGIMLLFLVIGCSSSKRIDSNKRRTQFEKIDVALQKGFLINFSVSEQGEVFVVGTDGKLRWYQTEGALKTTLEDSLLDGTDTIVCVENKLYLYQGEKGRLVCLDTETEKITVILEDIELGGAMNLVSAGDKLYLLAAGEVQYHHNVYEIDCEKKKISSLEIQDVSAIYGAADGTLYYCQKEANVTSIYRFNGKEQPGEPVFEFFDTLKEDTLTAFILEQDYLVYSTLGAHRLIVCSVAEEKQKIIREDAIIYPGKNMECVAGNVIYYSYGTEEKEAEMGILYLPEQILTKSDENDSESDKTERPKLSGSLKISVANPAYYDPSEINQISGIRARLQQNMTSYLTELMTQDDGTDIYIMHMTSDVAQELKKNGYFVALNDSNIICDYKEKCFDYIADEMTTENGEIWALPIDITSQLIWYVPENFEKHSLSVDALKNWEDFFDLSEKVENFNDSGYVESAGNFGMALWNQYDAYYNDFANGKSDYRTELFKGYFQKMWTGWKYHDQQPKHPRLNIAVHSGEMVFDYIEYKKDSTMFCMAQLNKYEITYRSEKEWRVAAVPKLSEKITKNLVTCNCMIINPASKKKDLALAYLETIAEKPGKINAINTEFIFKDKKMYGNRYDFSDSQIQDIYDVMKNGKLSLMSNIFQLEIIGEYQDGRYTLEEAIEKIQRDTEFWLNE